MSKPSSKPKSTKPQQKPIEEVLLQRFGPEQFKGQNKLKHKIFTIQTQNEINRSKMFQLNETVTKIIDKSKIRKGPIPMLENQLAVVSQQLINIEKLIEIYRKNIKGMSKKGVIVEQVQSITDSNLELRERKQELEVIRKEVKMLENKNKGLETKLGEKVKRNKMKSVEEYNNRMKEAVIENKVLRKKLEQVEEGNEKRAKVLQINYKSTKQLQEKVPVELLLIKSSRIGAREERSKTSMSRLENEKKIYQKWFKTFIPNNLIKVQKQIEDFQKITTLLIEKITDFQKQIQKDKRSLFQHKQQISPSKISQLREESKAKQKQKQLLFKNKPALKNSQTNCNFQYKIMRKDWVGNFNGLRFSDSRYIKQQTRLYKVTHNNIGYYQFSYYSVKNPKKKYNCELPFSVNSALTGKESIFEVDYPDYVKEFKLRIGKGGGKIVGMEIVSNLGMGYEFVNALENGGGKEGEGGVNYNMKVKSNEAPSLMFGSYSAMYDEKKNLIGVHLEGLGMEIVEDYVEEMI